MTLKLKNGTIVIGKRIPVGQFVLGITAALAYVFPEHAVLFTALSMPAVFIAQVLVANIFPITTKDVTSADARVGLE